MLVSQIECTHKFFSEFIIDWKGWREYNQLRLWLFNCVLRCLRAYWSSKAFMKYEEWLRLLVVRNSQADRIVLLLFSLEGNLAVAPTASQGYVQANKGLAPADWLKVLRTIFRISSSMYSSALGIKWVLPLVAFLEKQWVIKQGKKKILNQKRQKSMLTMSGKFQAMTQYLAFSEGWIQCLRVISLLISRRGLHYDYCVAGIH